MHARKKNKHLPSVSKNKKERNRGVRNDNFTSIFQMIKLVMWLSLNLEGFCFVSDGMDVRIVGNERDAIGH